MESIQVQKAFVVKIFTVSSVAYGTSVNTFYCALPMYLQLQRLGRVVSLRAQRLIDLINFFIFIFLSQKSGVGAMRRTNPDSLRSCFCFQVFVVEFSDFFNFLLARFHQAEIIIVKHLIQGRNNETRLGVKPLTSRSWSS